MAAISQGAHGARGETVHGVHEALGATRHGACEALEEEAHGACGEPGEAVRGPMAGRLVSALNWMGAQTLEALSPTRCAGCEAPGRLVCDACLERFELIDPAGACARCGAPFGRMLCTECNGRETTTGRCLAAAVFQDPLARMIRMYKDAGERRLAQPFAEMLYDTALHAQDADAERFVGLLTLADALVFVPATARAFRRRGFDHMEAIARALAELSGVPVVDALVKRGAGDQREWGRSERLMHSHGVYEVVPETRGALAGARVLLLDDVITTGATVAAAASTLREAGACGVDALALARVMGPSAG